MSKVIFIMLCGLHGALSAKVGVGANTWQYYVLLACVLGSYICGALRK